MSLAHTSNPATTRANTRSDDEVAVIGLPAVRADGPDFTDSGDADVRVATHAPDKPRGLAESLLEHRFEYDGMVTLVLHNGAFQEWDSGRYHPLPDSVLRNIVVEHAQEVLDALAAKTPPDSNLMARYAEVRAEALQARVRAADLASEVSELEAEILDVDDSTPDGKAERARLRERLVGLSAATAAAKRRAVAKRELMRSLAASCNTDSQDIGSRTVSDMIEHLGGICNKRRASRIDPELPVWLDGDVVDRPNPKMLMAFRNGLLDVQRAALEGPDAEGVLMEHTPLFHNTTCVDYAFDPAAPEPRVWLEFLNSVWPDDPGSIRTLRQWFGAALVGGLTHEKMLMITGAKRSGKGTICDTLAAVLGQENCADLSLNELDDKYALEPAVGKQVILVRENRMSGGNKRDLQLIIERLLRIASGEPVVVRRMRKDTISAVLPRHVTIVANGLPDLPDRADALLSRFLLLVTTRSFAGQEDLGLEAKLKAERASVLVWALGGLSDLLRSGRFHEPESGQAEREAYQELNNPLATFGAEMLDFGPECESGKASLYEAYNLFRLDQGIASAPTLAQFCRNLYEAFRSEGVTPHRRRDHEFGDKFIQVIRGVQVKPEVLRRIDDRRDRERSDAVGPRTYGGLTSRRALRGSLDN
jgi:P4 family phage/plasmid primase-like protien